MLAHIVEQFEYLARETSKGAAVLETEMMSRLFLRSVTRSNRTYLNRRLAKKLCEIFQH